jgi:hypothetical protein
MFSINLPAAYFYKAALIISFQGLFYKHPGAFPESKTLHQKGD